MPLAEATYAAPQTSELGWLETLRGALFSPSTLFGQLQPGPVAPAARLALLNLALPAVAGVLTDDTLYLGQVGPVVGRGIAMWLLGAAWLIGPQAYLFQRVLRLFGATARPLSLAQRGMGAFSALLAVFGSAMSIAGINPESAAFVISWYVALTAVSMLGTYALFRFAERGYGLSTGKAVGSVLAFELVHSIALVITLGVFFTITAP
jgi:hypothetical protein